MIEDNEGDALFIKELLNEVDSEFEHFQLHWRTTLNSGIEFTKENKCDLILLDLSLPDSSGFDTFDLLKSDVNDIPIIILSGLNNKEFTLNAVKKGAQDYLIKGEFNFDLLTRTIIYGIERHQMRKREKDLEKELMKSRNLESLGFLAGGIAHDFNNILTAILGNLSYGKIEVTPSSPLYEILNDAEKAAIQATGLTNQLLTFSKGGVPIKKITSIKDLVRDSANFILRGSNIKSIYDFQDDLLNIEVDEKQINQVINNIIINASQAMPLGGYLEISGKKIKIDMESGLPLKKGNYIEISFKDTGMGIPKENLSKIFDPYFSTKENGSGLGLATCYSILKKHGGHIRVNSQLRSGTTVYIYFPASNKKVEKIQKDININSVEKGRFLVLDDEKTILKIIDKMLSRIGFQSDGVDNGTELIQKYKEALENNDPYDGVILDLTIPGGFGGKDVISSLLEIDPNVQAIVSSGYSNDPIMSDYKKYGFCEILEKPYSIIKLAECLGRIMLKKKQEYEVVFDELVYE